MFGRCSARISHPRSESARCRGVYAIACDISGMVYVGDTEASFEQRWDQHVCQLENGKHHCELLQYEWTLHGRTNFSFLILTEGPNGVDWSEWGLHRREVEWIEHFRSLGICLNYDQRGLPFAAKGKARQRQKIGDIYVVPRGAAEKWRARSGRYDD